MFKVGDKVVFGSGLNAGLFTIKSKPKKNNGVLLLPVILPNGSWFDLMEQFVRHATPEEIAAFLNGVCRHEPAVVKINRAGLFLNGVCRHERSD